MAKELINNYSTDKIPADGMGNAVYEMMTRSKDSRRSFERRWYDNNFFDDGHHFRYLSRLQNKIVDLSDRSTIFAPLRAIPKASRQIRGVANLLLSQDPTPVVYPENINTSAFPPIEELDPQTGQVITKPNPEYVEAVKAAKIIARSSGHWISEEFKEQEITEKLALMVILAAKHGVSYMQIWPDAVKEAVRTKVFDAFDIFVVGSVNELEESPYIIKSLSRTIAEIKADERFDPEKVAKITPDNRQAASEIKDAYMKAKFGGITNPESVAMILEKEAFIKEYLNDNNMTRIRQQKNSGEILQDKKKGDIVIRHTFVEGNIEVLDEYVKLDSYPFIEFRMEPGPLYQVPLIERFIPANKSLDLISSRVERYTHTMVTGSWSKRKGEDFEINNSAGGQVLEYQATQPIQNQIAPIPGFVFQFMAFLTSLIEEQGVTTSALGKLPAGVKANAAIETLKETEFANLTIPLRRMKQTTKRIAQKLLEIADDYFVNPKTVYYLEKGEPQYFDIIGQTALNKRQALNVDTPENTIPISGKSKVDVQIESGSAYTKAGEKAAAKELGDFLIQLAQLQLVTPEVVKVYVEKLLDMYGFGATQEIMEAMEASGALAPQQVDQMKLAMAQVMKDLQGSEVLPDAAQRVDEGKVATAQTIQDVIKKGGQGG